MKSSGKLPSLIDGTGQILACDSEKADALGDYFSSVFSTHTSPSAENVCSSLFLSTTFDRIVPVDHLEVLKHLKALKPSCSATIDGIPQIIYKKCADVLTKPLVMMFDTSLLFGEIPAAWKEAIVTAIPKTNNSNEIINFRPISILPSPVKILEKILRERLLASFTRLGVIPPEQHGFTHGASTTTQLIDTAYDLNLALNSGKSIDVIYIDLSKAFDRVNHSKLLYRLEQIGVENYLLKWLSSYLSNRHMYVKVENSFSRRYPCPSGVPQGGVLSPLLFLAYCHDLPSVLKTHTAVSVQMYADDIKIYGSYNEDDRMVIHEALSHSLSKLMEWSNVWELPVNLAKTKVLHIEPGLAEIVRFVEYEDFLKLVSVVLMLFSSVSC
ncbi:hypothetical protein Y032_0715g1767 [Ancylostoma ceylanicum]|nr:hypothetical protein Y032_0715g1767 [Ancylostoma ceylanicum]